MPTSSSKKVATAVFAAAAFFLLTAGKKPSEDFTPSYPQAREALPANGAIFQASRGYAPLTSGNRAAQVGDLLTIVLVERTQAVKTSTANTGRSGSIGLTPPTTGPLALFPSTSATMGGNSSFDGKGQAAQSNLLTGEVSVTVAEVHPNGTMLVRGEKLVRLNQGDEYIRISGLIRQQDISDDNRIASTRVADARITYTGKGDIARASRQGWLQHFFSIVSPF
jgi:flagellar L-ring protein precursor FlgH